MLRVLGGIRPHPNASGFDHALIAVRPPRKLRSFSASFDSIRGRVETAWRWDEAGAIAINVSIPPGMRATVEVPCHSASGAIAVRAVGARPGTQAEVERDVSAGMWRPHLVCGRYGCSGVRSVALGSGKYEFTSMPFLAGRAAFKTDDGGVRTGLLL